MESITLLKGTLYFAYRVCQEQTSIMNGNRCNASNLPTILNLHNFRSKIIDYLAKVAKYFLTKRTEIYMHII